MEMASDERRQVVVDSARKKIKKATLYAKLMGLFKGKTTVHPIAPDAPKASIFNMIDSVRQSQREAYLKVKVDPV